MRELTLLETSYLAGLVLLSLLLPTMMSFRGPREAKRRRSCMRTVWIGQVSCAAAGVAILAAPWKGPFAALLGLTICLGAALVLLRQSRAELAPPIK